MTGRPPWLVLGLKEDESTKGSQALGLSLEYLTEPAKVPPYCGTPKLPMALWYVPFKDCGEVTVRLLSSTTKDPYTADGHHDDTTKMMIINFITISNTILNPPICFFSCLLFLLLLLLLLLL
jgi:hypothetical protein